MPRGSIYRLGGRQCRGFTLIELMVTVAVMSILAAIAAPSMIGLLNANRLAGMNDELAASLQLARSEAVRRSAPVTVCNSADGSTCSPSTSWTRWIVIGEDNATGTIDVIRDNEVTGSVEISGPNAGIVFSSSGLIRAEETLTVCIPTDHPAENQRVMTVMISGNIHSEKESGGGVCP